MAAVKLVFELLNDGGDALMAVGLIQDIRRKTVDVHGFFHVSDDAHPVQAVSTFGMTGKEGLGREHDYPAGLHMQMPVIDGNIQRVVKVEQHVLGIAARAHHGVGRVLRPVVADIDHEHGAGLLALSERASWGQGKVMRGWMQRNLYDIIDWNGGYVNFFGEFCICF